MVVIIFIIVLCAMAFYKIAIEPSIRQARIDIQTRKAQMRLYRRISRAENILTEANRSFMLGNYGDCIQLCEESLELYPHWKTYQLKAGSYFDMSEFKKARENAQKSVSLEPDFVTNQVSYIILAQTESL